MRITTNLELDILDGNSTLSLSKFVEVGSKNTEEDDSGNMLVLFAILIILTVCSYIIYSGAEDAESESILSEIQSDSDDEVNEDEHRRDFAIPAESSEEE